MELTARLLFPTRSCVFERLGALDSCCRRVTTVVSVRTGFKGKLGLYVREPEMLCGSSLEEFNGLFCEGGEGDFEPILRNLELLRGAAAVSRG